MQQLEILSMAKLIILLIPFICAKKYQKNTKKPWELNIWKSNYALHYKRKNRCLWKPVKDKKVSGKSQQQFIKGKSRLTNLATFYEETIFSEQRIVICLDFSKAFDTVSCDILLTDNLVRSELDRWTTRWVRVWLNCQAQGVVVNGSKSNWQLVRSGAPQGPIMDLILPSLGYKMADEEDTLSHLFTPFSLDCLCLLSLLNKFSAKELL